MTGSKQMELRRELANKAADYLREGYHCSEAVLLAVAPHVVREWHPACARLSTGFAGGIGGSRQEVCGALAGGIMVIGALFGRSELQDDALAQRLSKQLRDRFDEVFETTQCARLREDVVESEDGLGSCAVLVQRATMMLLQVLADAGVQLS